MRPVQKGDWPLRSNSATTQLVFNDWARAIPHLRLRTGDYCHLCEMRVTNAIAIEHIQPKEHFPALSNDWDNFLLICNYCNSEKLDEIPIPNYRDYYLWPHLNNTMLAFDLDLTTGLVTPRTGLNPANRQRVLRLIELYGLNKRSNASGASDPRYLERVSALYLAVTRRVEYNNGQATPAAIVDLAKTKGFFTVWLKVFGDVPEIKEALINCREFKVPVAECFGPGFVLKNRTAADL